MGRDGGPELVIRGEHPVVAMPVLPRRRHEGSEPVEELTWGKLDDDADARPRGLPPAPRANPVGRLVSREHVADAGDAAVFAADHGEPLQREGRPGTVSQQVLERLTIDTQLETKERDPDAGVNRKPTVLSSEHVGGRIGVEEPLVGEALRDLGRMLTSRLSHSPLAASRTAGRIKDSSGRWFPETPRPPALAIFPPTARPAAPPEPCDRMVANRSVPRRVYGRLLTPSTRRSVHGCRGHRDSRAAPPPTTWRPRAVTTLRASPPREDSRRRLHAGC
jgi:hypothetical protein